jgi:ribosomal protein S13
MRFEVLMNISDESNASTFKGVRHNLGQFLTLHPA